MKKLLILGGSRYVLPVIKKAHDLGIYVITADFLPDNIAHKYSDEYCNISITDLNATLKLAQDKKINGVISFACDPGVITAAFVAEKLGLPSCGPYESVCILQNKRKFREFLNSNGFHVPQAKGYRYYEEAKKDVSLFQWPVIVKPTDSAGSKGVSKVCEPSDLKNAVERALDFSLSKDFIVEEYITQKGFSSDTDSFSVNGVLKFVSFNSQRFDANAPNPYVPSAFSWPSSMTFEHQKELACELQRLLDLLRMKTAIYNIETREGTDGKAYIMECSPRGGGNRLAECLEYATGIKLVENAVRAAMDMPLVGIEQKPYKGNWAEVILHSEKPGVFDNLWVADELNQYIVERDIWVTKGTRIGGFSAANESVGTLIFNFTDKVMMEKVLADVNAYIKVILMKE